MHGTGAPLWRRSHYFKGSLQFLMTDGTVKGIPEVATVEAEQGRLVCRDRSGAKPLCFGHAEVMALADSQVQRTIHQRAQSAS
jgi:hypothetical protein